MTNSSIVPPAELVQQWASIIYDQTEDDDQRDFYVATRAAQWGADQELEACHEWVKERGWLGAGDSLCAARRPKPPSLKEQALAELQHITERAYKRNFAGFQVDIIRRALETIPND